MTWRRTLIPVGIRRLSTLLVGPWKLHPWTLAYLICLRAFAPALLSGGKALTPLSTWPTSALLAFLNVSSPTKPSLTTVVTCSTHPVTALLSFSFVFSFFDTYLTSGTQCNLLIYSIRGSWSISSCLSVSSMDGTKSDWLTDASLVMFWPSAAGGSMDTCYMGARGFPGVSDGEESACNAVWSLGWKNPLEKGMATHSSILAWRTLWTEEPGGLQSMGSQRVRHD